MVSTNTPSATPTTWTAATSIGQCSTDLGFPINDIAICAMYDGSMAGADDQQSAKKCFLVKRASLALYQDEHSLFGGRASKILPFLQIRLGMTLNYAISIENELLSLGVFNKYPTSINKPRIQDLYPTDCEFILRWTKKMTPSIPTRPAPPTPGFRQRTGATHQRRRPESPPLWDSTRGSIVQLLKRPRLQFVLLLRSPTWATLVSC